jgi:hypothetical protein
MGFFHFSDSSFAREERSSLFLYLYTSNWSNESESGSEKQEEENLLNVLNVFFYLFESLLVFICNSTPFDVPQ